MSEAMHKARGAWFTVREGDDPTPRSTPDCDVGLRSVGPTSLGTKHATHRAIA